MNTLLDREWTEPPPGYAFASEHSEGVIVVDTVYLPTHDPETAARLAERRPIGAAREEAIA